MADFSMTNQVKPDKIYRDLIDKQMPKDTILQRNILTRHSSPYRIVYGTAAATILTAAFGHSLAIFKEAKPGPLMMRYGAGGFVISFAFFAVHELVSGAMKHKNPVIVNPLCGAAVFVPIFLYQLLATRGTIRYAAKMAEKYAVTMCVFSSYWDIYLLWKRRRYIGVKKNLIHQRVAEILKEKKQNRVIYSQKKFNLGVINFTSQVADDSQNDWKKWGLSKPEPKK